MKKYLLLLVLICSFKINHAQLFTSGNIVVMQIGDAVGTLTSSGNPIFLREFNVNGTPTASLALPTGTNALILGGAASSEGALMLSPNNTMLSFGAYNISPGTSTVSLASSNATYIPRVAVGVDANGTITRTASTTFFSANNIRAVANDGNGNYWGSGANTGISYFGTYSTAATTATQTTNTRCVNISNNNLYFSASSGTALGIVQVSGGLSSSAGQTNSLIINSSTGSSAYGFYFNPTQTICYVADDRATAAGGIQKWTYASGTWSLAYTLGTGVTNIGARGVAVDFSGANPIIYGTSAEASNNRIFKIVDNGPTATASTIATATTNTIFRGLAFSPCLTPSISSVSANTLICASQGYSFSVIPSNTANVSYSWAGPGTLDSYTVSNPNLTAAVAGDYTVSVTNACGTSSAVVSISINPTPTITANSASICLGATATITASGANSYTWSNSNISGSIAVSPSVNTTYTVAGTNAIGCMGSTTAAINVLALPNMIVNSATICSGNAATINVSGANTYTWSNSSNNNSITPSPSITTAYAVNGTDNNGCINSATATVFVNQTPTLSMNNSTICAGQTATITVSGASTYTWSTASNNNSIAVSPALTTVYTCTGSVNGCIAGNNATIAVTPNPTISVINQTTICAGNSLSITASGASTYTWSNGFNTAGINVTPGTNTVYTVIGAANNCTAANSTTVTVNSLPIIAVANASICAGNTAAVSASGANTYTWSNSVVANSITVNPTVTAVYSVTGTSSLGCIGNNTATVTVNPLPNISAPTLSICAGSTATLIASGAATYTWDNGSNSNAIVVSPTVNTNYTVNAASAFGCLNTTTTSVVLSASLSLNVNSPNLCIGNTATLNVTGAVNYTWNTGAGTTSILVTPTVNTVYTITGTNASGCSGTGAGTVFVYGYPTLTTNSATLCVGQSATLNASGATSYLWNNAATTSSILITPTVTSVYSVSGTSNGCATNATMQVVVNPLPVITANSTSVCNGASVGISASGALTYTWNNGSNLSTVAVSPTATTIYTVNGTSSLGCIGNSVLTVSVNPIPTISVNSASICTATNATLTASGASSYTWSNNNNGNSTVVSPTTTTTYSIIGASSAGCINTASTQVVVYSLPTISVVSGSICSGQAATLQATGANTYTWSTSTINSSIVVTPSSTTNYSVNGTSASGCVNVATVQILVVTMPTVSVNSGSLCAGNALTLNATGASTYSWSTAVSGNSVVVNPSASQNYTVIGINQGCSAQAVATVQVFSSPTVAVNSTSICSGNSVVLTASGAASYLWNNNATTATINVNPAVTTNYTVTGTQNGCSNVKTVTVTVNQTPTLTISSSTAVCKGTSVNLSAGGAAAYLWNTGATTASIQVTPTVNSSYTVTGTSALGCSNTAVSNVSVNPSPTVSLTLSKNNFCQNDAISSLTYTGSPATGSVSGIPSSFTPGTFTVSYIVTATNNCVGTDSKTFSVSACTAIDNNIANVLLTISPNPFNNVLVINGLNNQQNVITVMNYQGQIVFQSTSPQSSESIDLSALQSGLYIVMVSDQNKTSSFKVIKQ